jgi:hypothetical protein
VGDAVVERDDEAGLVLGCGKAVAEAPALLMLLPPAVEFKGHAARPGIPKLEVSSCDSLPGPSKPGLSCCDSSATQVRGNCWPR